jgi:hypothetical protein
MRSVPASTSGRHVAALVTVMLLLGFAGAVVDRVLG